MTTLDIRRLPDHPRRHRLAADDQWQLPLEGCLAVQPESHPCPRPALELVEPPAPSDHMEARALAIVQVLVEVAGGHRPLSQLIRCTTPEVHDEIARRLATLARVRTSGPRRTTATPRSRVASVHVSRPAGYAAEISARIVQGPQSRALALRLELRDDRRDDARWTCVAVAWG
ncbi:Rv3235 family protein [Solicola sp. PLA-1-18]|uniref:Rv3235 family protein n=1 Tax=Solicola sp. PLA-1-18 TaxID=3380532 RepID=UPI003B7AC8F8